MMRFVLALVLLCSQLLATDYYVDPTSGDNDNAGTSTGAAWQEIPGTDSPTGTTTGWVTIGNGDRVIVKGGETISSSVLIGTSNYTGNAAYDSIQIVSGHLEGTPWGTGYAVIDATNTDTYGFWIKAIDGVTIDGFEVKNIAAGGVGLGFDTSSGSSCIAIGGAAADYVTVRNCYLHDAARTIADTGHGIETSGACTEILIEDNIIGPNIGTKGIEMVTATSLGRIRRNYLNDWGDHGIVISGQRFDVYNNIVRFTKPLVNGDGWAIKCDGSTSYASDNTGSNNDIWNNIVYNDPYITSPVLYEGALGIATWEGEDNRLYNNVVYQFNYDQSWGTYTAMRIGEQNDSSDNSEAQNNIVMDNDNTRSTGDMQIGINDTSTGINVSYNNFWSRSDSSSTLVINVYHTGGSPDDGYTSATFNSTTPNSWTGTGNEQQDPLFEGGTLPTGFTDGVPNTDFFKLTASSPAALRTTNNSLSGTAGQGYSTASDKFDLDIEGNTRTNWSMGPYEYVTESPGSSYTGQLRLDSSGARPSLSNGAAFKLD